MCSCSIYALTWIWWFANWSLSKCIVLCPEGFSSWNTINFITEFIYVSNIFLTIKREFSLIPKSLQFIIFPSNFRITNFGSSSPIGGSVELLFIEVSWCEFTVDEEIVALFWFLFSLCDILANSSNEVS